MDKTPREAIEFWDRRSAFFPRHDDSPGNYADKVLAQIADHGISFRGKTVLDAGAGTGQFAIKLARLAKSVVALDISEGMLAVCRADAEALGVPNIEYVKSPLTDYLPPSKPDIAFCSMCPALKDDQAKRWLLGSASGAVIYLGFNGYVYPGPMEGLIKLYGVERKLFNSGPDMENWLGAAGQTFARYPLTGNWHTSYPEADGLEWCLTMLKDYGVADPDPKAIKDSLAPFRDKATGRYVFETPYFVDLLIWETKNP
ncbi:MAG: methyltransferase domain-containing protein [Deltaproteobacteria bacterium]|jgi:SAM-dependent methyltransferase|nr:methyltransferase domain-containing protein [Deltaproteobacteria bacterium]